jgi:hypothetical protein
MQKAASKVRRETKVVVATEGEQTFEQENFSEIVNANNEVAVTYEYQKLQQQYEVFTYLAEIQSVIFVAERLPQRIEITEDWIRRYDWIIARALKDDSHRQTLNELIQDVEEANPLGSTNPPGPLDSRNPFYEMRGQAKARFAKFTNEAVAVGQGTLTGLSVPDIYAEPQRIYQDHLRDQSARSRANRVRQIRRRRLIQHIRNNILHYCHAIWVTEDSDQRILRYKKEGRRVPIEWRAPITVRNVGKEWRFAFDYEPTGKTAPLWQIIDPTGPIGYVGNYAVFGIRPGAGRADRPFGEADFGDIQDGIQGTDRYLDLSRLLGEIRAPYVGSDGELKDPALRLAVDEADEKTELTQAQIEDLLSYLPRLEKRLLDANGEINPSKVSKKNPITKEEWGEYLYRKNGTRRFLVDSNNLYLNLRVGIGAALETFKRAHRYIDVLSAYQDLRSRTLKNLRRETHVADHQEFDPDIQKVVVVGNPWRNTATDAAIGEALGSATPETTTEEESPPVGSDGSTVDGSS